MPRMRLPRSLAVFLLGFLIAYVAIALFVEIEGTRNIVCAAVIGIYCNRFYPEAFFLNYLFEVPSDSVWASPLTLLSWAILAMPGGLGVVAIDLFPRRKLR